MIKSNQSVITACLTCSRYNKLRKDFMCDLAQCYHFPEECELYEIGEWISGTAGVQLRVFNEIRKAGLAFHGTLIEEPALSPEIDTEAVGLEKSAQADQDEDKSLRELVGEIRKELKQMGKAFRELIETVKGILHK